MEAILSTLASLTAGMGMAMYLKGQVPLNTPMPYLVWEAEQPAFGEDGACTVQAWYTDGDANEKRIAAAGALGEIFPLGGRICQVPGGIIVIRRENPFLTLVEGEEGCCGVEVRVVLRWYGL